MCALTVFRDASVPVCWGMVSRDGLQGDHDGRRLHFVDSTFAEHHCCAGAVAESVEQPVRSQQALVAGHHIPWSH